MPVAGTTDGKQHQSGIEVVSAFRGKCSCGWRGPVHRVTTLAEQDRWEHVRSKLVQRDGEVGRCR